MSKNNQIENINQDSLDNKNKEKNFINSSLIYLHEIKIHENSTYNPFVSNKNDNIQISSKESKIENKENLEKSNIQKNKENKLNIVNQNNEKNLEIIISNEQIFPENKIEIIDDDDDSEDFKFFTEKNNNEINKDLSLKNSNKNINNDVMEIENDEIKEDNGILPNPKDTKDIFQKYIEEKNKITNKEEEISWFNRDGRQKLDEYAEINIQKLLKAHEKQINKKENKISELESLQFEMYFVKVNSDEEPKKLIDCKRPKIRFCNLNSVPEQLKKNIDLLKYDYLTPIQRAIMPYIQIGKDIVCISETGSGKTLSYLFPIIGQMLIQGVPKNPYISKIDKSEELNSVKNIYKDKIAFPLSLIIVPSRELAMQITNESLKLSVNTGIKTVGIIGGMSKNLQIVEIAKGCDILVGTPLRIIDFLNIGIISLKMVKFLILDESEKMLEPDFYEQLKIIFDKLPPKKERQNLLFSATFNEEVKGIAKYCLNNYYYFRPIIEMPKQIIHEFVKFNEYLEKIDYLINYLKKEEVKNKSIIIFINFKQNIEDLKRILEENGIICCTIHGDKSQKDRFKSLNEFILGYKNILISTDIISRGIDFPNVYCIINFDMPNCIDDYIHRVGRTGRLGQEGRVITYIDGLEDINKENLIHLLKHLNKDIPDWLNEVKPQKKYNKISFNRKDNDINDNYNNNNASNKFRSKNDNNNNSNSNNKNYNNWNDNNNTEEGKIYNNNKNDNDEWGNGSSNDWKSNNNNWNTNNDIKNKENNNNENNWGNDIGTDWNKNDNKKFGNNNYKEKNNNNSWGNNNNNFYNDDNISSNNERGINNFRGRGRGRKTDKSNFINNNENDFNNNENNNIEIPSEAFEELFLIGIHYDANEEELKEIFSKYGEIVYIRILKNKETNKSRGLGFVKFVEKKSAFLAMKDADNISCKGRKIKMNYSNLKDKENKVQKQNNFEQKNENINYSNNDWGNNFNQRENSKDKFEKENEERRVKGRDRGRGRGRGRELNKRNSQYSNNTEINNDNWGNSNNNMKNNVNKDSDDWGNNNNNCNNWKNDNNNNYWGNNDKNENNWNNNDKKEKNDNWGDNKEGINKDNWENTNERERSREKNNSKDDEFW